MIEYDTRTHHSNMDVFDRIQADDMKQTAIIMAAFVYQTAMMDEKMPRRTTHLVKGSDEDVGSRPFGAPGRPFLLWNELS